MSSAKLYLIIVFISTFFGAVAFLIYFFRNLEPKAIRFETTIIEAKVSKKNYVAEYTTTNIIMAGQIAFPLEEYHSEEFNVFITFDGQEFCLNDKDLFSRVNFGDFVKVRFIKGYKKNKLVSTKIELFTE